MKSTSLEPAFPLGDIRDRQDIKTKSLRPAVQTKFVLNPHQKVGILAQVHANRALAVPCSPEPIAPAVELVGPTN